MTVDLATVGAALYGPSWRDPLAKALDVSRVTLWRWINHQPPHDHPVWQALRDLAALRRREIEDAIKAE